MPVKSRRRKMVDDYPAPGEPRPVSVERWQRHRETLLANAPVGRRPEEWWAYKAPRRSGGRPRPGASNMRRARVRRRRAFADPWWSASLSGRVGLYTIPPGTGVPTGYRYTVLNAQL